MEAAWAYQRRPWIGGYLLRRQRDLKLSEEVKEIAWKAQYRLHKRYINSRRGGKNKNQTVTAVGRELLGFIWDIAVQNRTQLQQRRPPETAKKNHPLKTEGRADGSGRAHEKENPPTFYAVRPPGPTRALSPRQLPTDHDPAVPTREYQSDQSSLSAPPLPSALLSKRKGLALPLSRKIQPGRTTNSKPVKPGILSVA